MVVGQLRGNPATGSALEEADLEEERLVDVLDRVDFFGRAERLIRTVIRRRRPENRGGPEDREGA